MYMACFQLSGTCRLFACHCAQVSRFSNDPFSSGVWWQRLIKAAIDLKDAEPRGAFDDEVVAVSTSRVTRMHNINVLVQTDITLVFDGDNDVGTVAVVDVSEDFPLVHVVMRRLRDCRLQP
jgi:hypothetical protein